MNESQGKTSQKKKDEELLNAIYEEDDVVASSPKQDSIRAAEDDDDKISLGGEFDNGNVNDPDFDVNNEEALPNDNINQEMIDDNQRKQDQRN